MTDFSLEARAREGCPRCGGKGYKLILGGIDENDVGFTYDKPKRVDCLECQRVESALRDTLQAAEDVARAVAEKHRSRGTDFEEGATSGAAWAADAIQRLRTTQRESRDTGSRSVCSMCGGSGKIIEHHLNGDTRERLTITRRCACGGDGKGAGD